MVSTFIANGSTTLLTDLALIIILATIIALIFKVLKQPMVPAYVLTGFILGPAFLGIIKNQEIISTLSEIGIAFLLFIVGLEMDLRKLQRVGFIATIGGTVQIILTFFLGYFIGIVFNFTTMASFYLGLIVAFSSTMIVVKLLSDTEEIQTLHGKISIGILLMQDLLVILVLAILTTLDNFSIANVGISLLKGAGIVVIAVLLVKTILPGIFKLAAKSQELLFLTAITMCFLFAALAVQVGFSLVVGAFIAGVSLATLPYNLDIIGRVRPLKDFFATIFFVFLGMQLVIVDIKFLMKPLIFLLLIVIIAKPFILMVIGSIFGYGKRTSFLNSLYLAQISEFSLILVAVGLSLGHINQGIFSITIILAIVSIVLTAYLVKYRNQIFDMMDSLLALFEKLSLGKQKLHYLPKIHKNNIILFGCHRMGSIILHNLLEMKKKVLVVDYNPETVEDLMKYKIPCAYGDIENEEILKKVGVHKAKIIVSTVPDKEDNSYLINYVRRENPNAKVLVTANHLHEAFDLYSLGADYVIFPHVITAEKLTNFLEKIVKGKGSLKRIRDNHLKHLTNIKLFGYETPSK